MEPQRVAVADIDIPFWRLVFILLKWMLASIPALILFYLIMGTITMLFGGLFLGLFHGLTGFVH